MLAVKRLFAYWLDFTILAIIIMSMQLTINYVTEGWMANHLQSGPKISIWVISTVSVPVWSYFIINEYFAKQTIGKNVMKLQVKPIRNDKLSFLQAVMRTAVKLLPWELTHLIILLPDPWWNHPEKANHLIYIPNLLIIIYVVFLFITRGRQAIHDILPKTYITY